MPEFLQTTKIGELVDLYLDTDYRWQERARNGMTRDMFVRATTLNEYLNRNVEVEGTTPDGTNDLGYTMECLEDAAERCANFYLIEPALLVQDFLSFMGTTFFDPEHKKTAEKEMAELKLRRSARQVLRLTNRQ